MRCVALVPLLLLAGCAQPVLSPWPEERPAGWDAGLELEVYGGFRAHSADQTLLAAPRDRRLPRPAGCAAYQDGRQSAGDACEVRDADGIHGPWTLRASWDGRGEDLIEQERDEGRRTVVAFAADGTVVAHVPRAVALAVE